MKHAYPRRTHSLSFYFMTYTWKLSRLYRNEIGTGLNHCTLLFLLIFYYTLKKNIFVVILIEVYTYAEFDILSLIIIKHLVYITL